MNVVCNTGNCRSILSSECVFYEGDSLIYTGILTNNSVEVALQKIDAAFGTIFGGFNFENGIYQSAPGAPVQLGGSLIQNTTITGNYKLTFVGNLEAASFITTGGLSSQFVKGDGTLDSTSYQISGNYITSLTGDGTANGPGASVFTLTSVNPDFGTWGDSTNIPVVSTDAKGRITNISTVPISIPSSSISFDGDLSGAGFTGGITTLTLNTVNTGVFGTDTPLKFGVNGKGLVTSASLLTNLDLDAIYGYTPVPNSRTITINGDTKDLTNNRSWTISGTGHTIQYNGTPVTNRTNLNFTGSGVVVTDDSGNDATVVTISGGGTSFINSVSNTNTVDLTVTVDDLTADINYQNTSTVLLSEDVSGLKADFASLNISQFTNDSGYITSIAGAVTSVSGTTNRITSTGGSTPVIDIDAAYDALWQPISANLTSLSGLAYVSSSFVKMTGANTFSLDTNTYPTISDAWLTASGGTLTGVNTISQAGFDINFLNGNHLIGPTGATITPSTRLDVRGIGTTTNNLLRLADSADTARLTVLDNGSITGVSDAGSTPFRFRTSTATNFVGFNPSTTSSIVFGNSSGTASIGIQSGATNLIWVSEVVQSKGFTFSNSTSADTNAPKLFRSGTTSSGNITIDAGATSTSNTLRIAFTSQENGSTGQTRVLGTNYPWTRSSGTDGVSLISLVPVINTTGTYSGTFRGFVYDPTLTSTTGLTNYAFLASSGLSGFGTLTPTATLQAKGRGTTTSELFRLDDSASTNRLLVLDNGNTSLNGDFTFADAKNLIFNTTTGTKIGTSTTQKIGFWNTTPIVQPTTAGAASTFVANTSLIFDDTATFDGYTIGQVVKALRNLGILA